MCRGIFKEDRGEELKYLSLIFIAVVFLRTEVSSSKTGPRYNTSIHTSKEIDGKEFSDEMKKIESKTMDLCKGPKERCEIWKTLTNPKSPEFWKEGNHIPDHGWITMVQDMTVDSAKLFLLRGEIKALYLQRAMKLIDQAQIELVSEGLMEDRYNVVANKVDQLKRRNVPKLSKSQLKNLQYFFIFSPSCPHCKNLSRTLVGLPNVYPLQATQGKLYHFDGLNKTERASTETLKGYAPNGIVPVLVLHHSTSQKAVVLRGNQTIDQIMLASAQLLRSSK